MVPLCIITCRADALAGDREHEARATAQRSTYGSYGLIHSLSTSYPPSCVILLLVGAPICFLWISEISLIHAIKLGGLGEMERFVLYSTVYSVGNWDCGGSCQSNFQYRPGNQPKRNRRRCAAQGNQGSISKVSQFPRCLSSVSISKT